MKDVEQLAIKIIFEDDFFLAIDKPSGLVVHNDGRTDEKSLTDWIKINFPDLESVGNPHTLDSGRYENRWGIVNRLDRETSGIILIAKNLEVFESLQKQFSERSIEKEYLAICYAKTAGLTPDPSPKERGVVREPLSRHKKDPRIWVLQSEEGSRKSVRDAETRYEVQTPPNLPLMKGRNLVQVKFWPKTGRTHQIRLHAKFLGIPILGDKKYGYGGIDNVGKEDAENRLMLHAKSLKLLHLKTSLEMKIESELPEEFKTFFV